MVIWTAEAGLGGSLFESLPEYLLPLAQVHSTLLCKGDEVVAPRRNNRDMVGVVDMLLEQYRLVAVFSNPTLLGEAIALRRLPCFEHTTVTQLEQFLKLPPQPAIQLAAALEELLGWEPERYGRQSALLILRAALIERMVVFIALFALAVTVAVTVAARYLTA